MTDLLRYLLRSRRGVLGTVIASAVSMLAFGFGILLINLPSFYYAEQAVREYIGKEELAYMLRFVPGDAMEIASLLAAGIWFAMTCGNAFRFGTANGVSRCSVIKATLVSAAITAAAVTAVTQGIRLGLVYGTRWFRNDSFYTALFSTNYGTQPVVTLSPSLNVRAALTYFLAACLLLTAVCCLYALYRRFAGVGLLCGSLVSAMLIILFLRICNPVGALVEKLHDVFYKQGSVQAEDFYRQIPLLQPKALPHIVSAVVLVIVFICVYAVILKKTAIRPEHR